jgi:hypothetical protein
LRASHSPRVSSRGFPACPLQFMGAGPISRAGHVRRFLVFISFGCARPSHGPQASLCRRLGRAEFEARRRTSPKLDLGDRASLELPSQLAQRIWLG